VKNLIIKLYYPIVLVIVFLIATVLLACIDLLDKSKYPRITMEQY